MSLIYNAVKAFDSIVIDTYFRKITVIGLENIPKVNFLPYSSLIGWTHHYQR